MTIFDQYFESWDAALLDEAALEDLVDLFADDVQVKTPQGDANGKEVIAFGIKTQLKKYVSMKHVWNAKKTDEGFKATWAVIHELKSGEMHAAVGVDFLRLNSAGKIQYLEINPGQDINTKIE